MDKVKSILRKLNCFAGPKPIKVDPGRKIKSPSPATSHANGSGSITKDQAVTNIKRAEHAAVSVVIAHGAFQIQYHYQLFIDALRKHTNIDRILVPQQSSSGPSPPVDSFAKDIKLLHQTVADEIEQGQDVLLICHSYGGIPGCEALFNLPTQRPGSETKAGRILGIVFVSAFVAEAGQSLVTSKMAGRASWVRTEGPLSYVVEPAPTLFNCVSSPTLVQDLVSRLVPQSSTSFITPTTTQTWTEHPCVYVRCLHDQAMFPEEQNYFISRLRRLNPDSKVLDLEADHIPFASCPEKLAQLTVNVVSDLRKAEGEGGGGGGGEGEKLRLGGV